MTFVVHCEKNNIKSLNNAKYMCECMCCMYMCNDVNKKSRYNKFVHNYLL